MHGVIPHIRIPDTNAAIETFLCDHEIAEVLRSACSQTEFAVIRNSNCHFGFAQLFII